MQQVIDFFTMLEPSVGETTLIGVDGHGGSGKSTFASQLATLLKAETIHIDDFTGWHAASNWHTNLISLTLNRIKEGTKTLDYPRAKWWEDHCPEPVVDQPVTSIMILEGIGAIRKELRQHLAYSIFVDTPYDECLRRGVNKDQTTGKTVEELTKLWTNWLAYDLLYFDQDNPQSFANATISGKNTFQKQLKELSGLQIRNSSQNVKHS